MIDFIITIIIQTHFNNTMMVSAKIDCYPNNRELGVCRVANKLSHVFLNKYDRYVSNSYFKHVYTSENPRYISRL